MARVKLQMPAHQIFDVQIGVRITDINYGNHLGNDSLVGLLHEARLSWLHSLGLSELNIGGAGLIMADLVVEFKLESFYADVLNIQLYVEEVSKAGFDLFYAVINQNNKLVAKAKTGMICFNYELRKVSEIPEAFKKYLEQASAEKK